MPDKHIIRRAEFYPVKVVIANGIYPVEGYPMWNKNLEEAAVAWLKELMEQAGNEYGPIDTIYPWSNTYCYNDFLREISIYSVKGLRLKREFHQIYSLDGSVITDTLGCEFNYRFNYPIYYKFCK